MPGMGGRMSVVIKAKINKLLDRAEDPSETLEYSYQKQMELLQNVKKGIADVVTSKKRLQLQQQKLEQQVVKLDTQARQALSQGREDLARTALERKQFAQGELQSLDQQVAELESQQASLIEKEQKLRSKIDQFRTKKEVIKAQYSAAEASVKISEAASGVGEEMADVGMAMQRALDKTEDMRARAGAMEELEAAGAFDDNLALGSGSTDDIDRELHQLTSQSEVDDDLERLKAELGAGSPPQPSLEPPARRSARRDRPHLHRGPVPAAGGRRGGAERARQRGRGRRRGGRRGSLPRDLRADARPRAPRGHAARRGRARGVRRDPPAARHLVRRGVGGVHRRGPDPRLTRESVTRSRLTADLRRLGVRAGGMTMVHTRMSALGWVVGGSETVVRSLLDVSGTVMVYASWADHVYTLEDWPRGVPRGVPRRAALWDPATGEVDPDYGRIPERVRTWPGALRSAHPEASVVAVGPRAAWLTEPHEDGYGAGSPFARLVEAGGDVLMLGAPLETVTLLHHAEAIASAPGKRTVTYEIALADGSVRSYTDIETSGGAYPYASLGLDADEFEVIARDALAAGVGVRGRVGAAECHLFPRLRELDRTFAQSGLGSTSRVRAQAGTAARSRTAMNARDHSGMSGQPRQETMLPSTTSGASTNVAPAFSMSPASGGKAAVRRPRSSP